MSVVIHTDGGSRGNPGHAATGFCVFKDGEVLFEEGAYLGIATNNEAEYAALISSLTWVQEHTQEVAQEFISWKLDSKLVVEQVNKRWKIKEARLLSQAQQCWQLLQKNNLKYSIEYVPRAQNACADALVNQALDART